MGQLEKERVRDFLRFVLVVTLQVVVLFPIPFFSPNLSSRSTATHAYTHPIASRHAGLNIFVVCIPLAWVSHFMKWGSGSTFTRM